MPNTHEKQTFWNRHIEACGKSGVSRRSYCESNNLPLSTFSYWKRRLADEGSKEKRCLVEVPTVDVPTMKNPATPMSTKGMDPIVIHLRDGIEIIAPISTPVEYLTHIIEALEKRQ